MDMLRKLAITSSIIVTLITVFSDYSLAEDSKDKNATAKQKNSIHPSMTLVEFDAYLMKCKDFVPFSANKIRHRFNDNRVRKFYKSQPLLSVVMRKVDINSYIEIIFKNDVLEEINQYDLDGKFIEKHSNIYCWQ
jgi:hypothetical protein